MNNKQSIHLKINKCTLSIQNFNKKVAISSILVVGLNCASFEALAYNQNASGGNVAENAITSKNEVAGNYNGTFSGCNGDECKISSNESPYDVSSDWSTGTHSFINPFDDKKYTTANLSYATSSDGGNAYRDIFDTNESGSRIAYYEGDYVSNAEFSAKGDEGYIIFHKNYAADATLSASDGSFLFATSNNVSGAVILSDSATLYLEGNIATNADIKNRNNSYAEIKNNDAGSANIANNNASMLIDSNYAEGAIITNSADGKLDIYNNNVSSASIENNNARMVIGANYAEGATIKNSSGGWLNAYDNNVASANIETDSQSETILTNNNATNATIINNGKLIASTNNVENANVNSGGYSEFHNNVVTGATLSNSGDMYLYNNSGGGTTFTNSGNMFTYGNKVTDASIVNNGYLIWSDCSDNSTCSENNSAEITNSSIDNNGDLRLFGVTDSTGSDISNKGNIYLDNVTATEGNLKNNGILYVLSSSSLMDTTNTGKIELNSANSILTINGNYAGNNGSLSISSVLDSDDSQTDKLVITGSATGTTNVSVTNQGGKGAQTVEGIEIISTGSSTKDAFIQSGRIAAGSYDYHLQQGTFSGANMNNWYLTSKNNNDTITYRPERGSYASNLAAAGTMFNTRLKDRQSGVNADPVTNTSLWIRTVGGHNSGRMSDGQSEYTANRMVFQMGGDVLDGSFIGGDAWHLGIMGGYGKQYSKTHNSLSGYHSKGEVWGYSSGLYGSWFQNANNNDGLYVDSWLLYNWFDNSVKGDELAYEKYKTKGFTASLESGYRFHTGSYLTSQGMENNVYVTPQAQVVWSGVQADNHTEQNGTSIQGRGNDNVQTRLGARLSMTGQSLHDKGSVRQFEPFVETNWVYTSKQYGVKMDGESAFIQGSRNVVEIKTGIEGRVSDGLSVWGNLAQQFGGHNYRDTQGVLGIKYAF